MKKALEKLPFYNTAVLPYHFLQTVWYGARAGWPARKLHVIGVTGTNGKTTTAFMIWQMLRSSGRKAGLMTTVAWGVDELEKQVEHMTTVDAKTLNARIRKIAEAGAEYLVLEVTSHALVQFRTLGVPIEIAVFTNLTHEHLDYHKTLERYRAAKCKLFAGAKYGVINADDGNATWFERAVGLDNFITYGVREGQVRAWDIKLRADGVRYSCGDIKDEKIKLSSRLRGLRDDENYSSGDIMKKAKGVAEAVRSRQGESYREGGMKVEIQLPGEFNVYNSLAAVCVGRKLGLTDQEIVRGLKSLQEVEGRMNRIQEGQNFEVIVDFAHTPDAFEKVFEAVAPAYGGTYAERTAARKRGKKIGRVISLFGGAGRRDEKTRAERGMIAGRYSDVIILTEDDSRDEDPRKIMEMFEEGVLEAGFAKKNLHKIMNREKAIEKAVKMAKKGDVVLVLGKGHEKTILRADGAHEFEDIKVVKKALRKLLG